MSLVTIKNKFQIVIPAKLRKAAGLNMGDFLKARVERKGEIIFSAQTIVDREKLAHLPKGIQEGLEDIRMGRTYGPFNTADELIMSLKKEMKQLHREKKK